MNIEIYLPHFPAAGSQVVGGTAKATHGLASALAGLGLPVTVLCEGARDSFVDSSAGYGIACFRQRRNRHPFEIASGLRAHLARANGRLITLLNGVFNPRTYTASRVLHAAGKPYIVQPFDPLNEAFFSQHGFRKALYWRLFESRVLGDAAGVQVLDPRHAEFVRGRGVRTRVLDVPCGYLPEDVVNARALRWRPHGPIRLMFLGRLDLHNKGLDLLLKAVGRLPSTDPWELTMQGSLSDEARLRKLASRHCRNKRITIRGPDLATSPGTIFLEHDVACYPSRFEGFGLAALEAMLSARVLLVSDVAGIAPHVARAGCGVVVEPDPEQILHGLRRLSARRERWRELGLRGRAYAIKNLTWEVSALRALRGYEQIWQPEDPEAARYLPHGQQPALNESPSAGTRVSTCA